MNAPLPIAITQTLATRLRLRVLEAGDIRAVCGLLKRHGHPARSREGLHWALLDNPTRVAVGAAAGWVLENSDGIVGFLGNLPLRCLKDGLQTWGATCTALLVDDDYRAHGIRLLRAFASQPGAHVLFVRSETMPAGTALERLGFASDPGLASQPTLRWPVGQTANSFLHLPKWVRRLTGKDRSTTSSEAGSGLQIHRLTSDELAGTCPGHWPQTWNDWANRLWSRPGLWTERSAYLMSWRLADPDTFNQLGLWAVRDGAGTLWGMVLARHLPSNDEGSSASVELLDWALLPTAPEACAERLLAEVKAWAQTLQVRWVEAVAFSGEAARQLKTLEPQRLYAPDRKTLVLHSSLQNVAPDDASSPDSLTWSCTGSENADWFFTGLAQIPEAAPMWHPARAPQVQPKQSTERQAVPTSSAFASQ